MVGSALSRCAHESNAFIMESIIAYSVNFVVISRVYIQGERQFRRRNSSACTEATLSTIIHSYLVGPPCKLCIRPDTLPRCFAPR